MNNKGIIIWGAGRIGRGFIGDLFKSSGYEINFIDEAQSLVDGLKKQGEYLVVRAATGGEIEKINIKEYSIYHTSQSVEIQRLVNSHHLMAVAVYPQNFPTVAKQLQKHLLNRKNDGIEDSFDILLCTNLIHAGPKFKEFLLEGLDENGKNYLSKKIGIVESLVIRICPNPPKDYVEKHPFIVWTNGYGELPVDKHGFKGEIPDEPFLRLVEDMRAEEIRKIYTYNMCHAVLSFHGHLMEYNTLVECLADEFILAEAQGALREINNALQKEYGFSAQVMEKWITGVLTQTNNPTIGDTVVRSAADPLRKLNRDDRLIGPILLCRKNGIHPKHLIRAVAAALYYREENDSASLKLAESIRNLGLHDTIVKYCGLTDEEEDLAGDVMHEYDKLPKEIEWHKKALEAYKLGFKYEKVYHGCGQCVIAAVTEALGVFDPEVFNAATGLCGGVGLVNEATCSSFTGGAMAIGLFFHRSRENFDGDRENKYINFKLVQKLREKFIEKYGTIMCGQIHTKLYGRPYDLRDKVEREAFEEAGGHGDHGCTEVVADGSKWTVEVLAPYLSREK